MAMTVLNNTSAMMTLGELNKNVSRVGKDLKKLSSGMKINSASDDASAYAISERMRVMMRSLDQDEQNVKNGRFLLNVAAGGIDNIVQELRSLKELALNSANDHNTDADRATIQKEFDQRMANIDDIAVETNYNGKILLDGRYRKKTESSWVASQIKPTSESPIMISSGNYTIAADGVYVLADGYKGTVTIANGVQNVKLQQQNPSVALDHTFIVGSSSGGANLWIKDLNIRNTFDSTYSRDWGIVMVSPAIKFQGTDNYLTLEGNNTFSRGNGLDFDSSDGSIDSYASGYPIIDAGQGLTIEAFGNGSVEVYDTPLIIRMPEAGLSQEEFLHTGWYYAASFSGAGIGFRTSDQDTYLKINSGNINVDMAHGVSESQLDAYYSQYAALYDQYGIYLRPQARMGFEFGDNAGIGGNGRKEFDSDQSNYGDVIINGGTITSRAVNGAGIGSNGFGSRIRDVIINGGDVTASSYLGEDIGAGYEGEIRSLIKSGKGGKGGPLVIHHGPKSNQALNVYINDMRTDAMGLTGTAVTTRDKATKAIETIDLAVDYALDEATNVGAYISRLEYTEENIVTANENTQASESTIRDADMAKEMMSYTKNNVLAQASQSMLAQANQNASSVLSLLQ